MNKNRANKVIPMQDHVQSISTSPREGERMMHHGRPSTEVLRDASVSPMARLLYTILTTYANSDLRCRVSRARLARDIGKSVRSVGTWLRELEERDIIRRETETGSVSTYALVANRMDVGGGKCTSHPEETYFPPQGSALPTPREAGFLPRGKQVSYPEETYFPHISSSSVEDQVRESECVAREEKFPPAKHPDPGEEEAADTKATSTDEEIPFGEGAPPADELPEGWSEEHRPILRAWREWKGDELMSAAMSQVIRLLLRPEGSGTGAKIKGKEYAGYTPEQIAQGIESMALSSHYSPQSLIKHVAGEMEPAGATHGNAHRGSSEKAGAGPTTHFQASREVGRSPFDPDAYNRIGDVLRAIDESESGQGEPPGD